MPESQANGKDQFKRVSLTIVFCALTLLVSAGIPGLVYMSMEGKQSFEMQDLLTFYGKNLFFFLQLLPFSLTLLVLLLCVRIIHRDRSLKVVTDRPAFGWRRAMLSFFVWMLVLLAFLLIEFLQGKNNIRWNYNGSFWILLIFSLIFVTLQTAFEEVFFRGYLLRYVFPSKNKWIPILMTSLLFGLMHLSNPEVGLLGEIVLVYYVGTGIFLALMAVLDRGLELSLGFHAANNLFATLILTNNWQVFQTDAIFKDYSPPAISSEAWINLLLLFPVLIFVYGKIFKWDFGVIFAKFAKNSSS